MEPKWEFRALLSGDCVGKLPSLRNSSGWLFLPFWPWAHLDQQPRGLYSIHSNSTQTPPRLCCLVREASDRSQRCLTGPVLSFWVYSWCIWSGMKENPWDWDNYFMLMCPNVWFPRFQMKEANPSFGVTLMEWMVSMSTGSKWEQCVLLKVTVLLACSSSCSARTINIANQIT